MRILYVQYANPGAYPPLEHSSRILAEKGWSVCVLGLSLRGTEALRFPSHPRIEVRLLKYCPPNWRQKLHYFRFAAWAFLKAISWRPDWIYVSDPLACPIALLLSCLPNAQVIYHEHDSPGAQAPSSRFIRFVVWARTHVARRAAFCVLPNQRRAELFRQSTKTARPVLCVWNCPRRNEAEENKVKRLEGNTFILFYHGSIVPARVPFTVLQAISLLPANVRFQVAGYETIGNSGYVNKLQAEAARLGIHDRFEYLGAFSRDALLPLCRKANVGLSLMPEDTGDINEQTMTGASNKPFDYLACGVPLLVSDLPEWRETFGEPGCAKTCLPSAPDTIAQSLRWFMEHPEEAQQMGERGRQRVLTDWNYETQFEPVMQNIIKRSESI